MGNLTRLMARGHLILDELYHTTTAVSPSTTEFPPNPQNYRLPTTLYPQIYTFSLKTYIPSTVLNDSLIPRGKNFTFDGNLTILILCSQNTNNITMHMNNIKLRINSFQLFEMFPNGSNGNLIPLAEGPNGTQYFYNPELQLVTFTLNNGLMLYENHTYKFSLRYVGYLTDKLVGFYRSSYKEGNKIRWMAITQFEATDARRALPCFDEPSFKAVFKVKIIHPTDMTALSNAMQIRNTSIDYGFSTYQKLHQEWEDFDMVAVPDFDSGAMENWGLVTYREVRLLYRQNYSYSPSVKQSVTAVIAHELAHQWFGDLVTMAWWDDLFLNEAFAVYLEYIATDHISGGSYHMADQFIVVETIPAMHTDQILNSHPISYSVEGTSSAISQLFDKITYNKGAAVLRMLNFTITETVFVSGLTEYLKNYKYANANHNQLWATLQRAVNADGTIKDWNNETLDVKTFMNLWIEQMGFPVVNAQRHNDTGLITLTQKRFLITQNHSAAYQNYSTNNSLYKAGDLSYPIALELSLYLAKETDYIPWASASSTFQFFNDMFVLTYNYFFYRQYILNIIAPIYNKIGWNESVAPASDVLNQISPTVRRAVYCSGIKHGILSDWTLMWKLYSQEQVAEERDDILYGLACTTEPYLHRKLLNAGLTASTPSSPIRSQDARYVFSYVSLNSVGRQIMWDYLTSNWDQLLEKYSESTFGLTRIVRGATRSFNTDYHVRELETFMAHNRLGSASESFKRQLENAKSKRDWMNTHSATVINWIRRRSL